MTKQEPATKHYRFEPVDGLPMSLTDYKVLREQLMRSCENVMNDDALENMSGYLHGFLDYLCPVRELSIYPVPVIIETVRKVRKWDATRKELVEKTNDLIKAIDAEIQKLENEV